MLLRMAGFLYVIDDIYIYLFYIVFFLLFYTSSLYILDINSVLYMGLSFNIFTVSFIVHIFLIFRNIEHISIKTFNTLLCFHSGIPH